MNNLKYLAIDKGLQLLAGEKVLEVKNIEINKGKAGLTQIEKTTMILLLLLAMTLLTKTYLKCCPIMR